jgi:hypothetical protein
MRVRLFKLTVRYETQPEQDTKVTPALGEGSLCTPFGPQRSRLQAIYQGKVAQDNQVTLGDFPNGKL